MIRLFIGRDDEFRKKASISFGIQFDNDKYGLLVTSLGEIIKHKDLVSSFLLHFIKNGMWHVVITNSIQIQKCNKRNRNSSSSTYLKTQNWSVIASFALIKVTFFFKYLPSS